MAETFERPHHGYVFKHELFDQSFWLKLCPWMTIDACFESVERMACWQERSTAYTSMCEDGYVICDHRVDEDRLSRLRRTITTLDENGFNPTCVYLYDDAWHVPRFFDSMLEACLGGGYRQIGSVYTFYVKTGADASGSFAHRDIYACNHRLDGAPNQLTLWFPVTHAGPMNGGIYLVPLSRDRLWTRGNKHGGKSWRERIEVVDPQDVLALHVDAGMFVAWNQNIMHWGGRTTRYAKEPRIAMASEFARADSPVDNELGFSDGHRQLGFGERLHIVGRGIADHLHHAKKVNEFDRWMARTLLGQHLVGRGKQARRAVRRSPRPDRLPCSV